MQQAATSSVTTLMPENDIAKCQLCNINMSKVLFEEHITSGKHKLRETNQLNYIRCQVCNTDVPKASFEQHVNGQKHIKIRDAKNEQRRVEQRCGIYVKGYPSYLTQDKILQYFAKYGQIVWSHFGPTYLLLDYSNPQAAETVLNIKRHRIEGRTLFIKYRQLRSQRPVKPDDVPLSNMADLKGMKDLSDQVATLTLYLQGSTMSVHIPKYNQICNDLENVLRYSFPMCQIYPFGSSITGLCFWSSDIDIYIAGIRRGNDEDIKHLYHLRGILNTSRCFTNLLVIGHAKIPLLKCVHTATGTNCDINIRNMLGVCNSNLILYYLGIDKKLKDMMLIIKYWARLHKMTGQNHLFTNYSFCMMIIFYLQGNPYQLPSVKYLQDELNFPNYQEMWNGGFASKRVFCPHIKSTSLLDLLSNFFSYYADFDYGSFVVCPYLGRPVKKSDFKEPDSLPNSFKTYKEVIKIEGNRPLKVEASICVQDPFEHTRNITPIVSDSTVNIFANFCRYAKQLAEEGEEGFLYKLFNQSPPNSEVERLTQNNFIQFGIQMGAHFSHLSSKIQDDVPDKTLAIKELWFDCVKKFTLIVLRDFLNFKVEEKVDSGSKKQKLDGQSDVHMNLGLVIVSYKCVGKLNVWHSRKSLLKVNDKEAKSIVERETAVTKQLLELYKHIDTVANIVEFDITLEKKIEPAQVVFNLTKIDSYKKTFRSFGEYFASKFGSWFETYLKEMNQCESC